MELAIRSLASAEDAAAFRALNEQWIAHHFVLESEDRRQLDDPVRAYLEPGGEILIAELDGRAVGCVAILPDGTGARHSASVTSRQRLCICPSTVPMSSCSSF